MSKENKDFPDDAKQAWVTVIKARYNEKRKNRESAEATKYLLFREDEYDQCVTDGINKRLMQKPPETGTSR